MVPVAILVAVSLALRAVDQLYHRDSARVLALLRLDGEAAPGSVYHRRWDPLFAIVPFVWSWLDLFAIALASVQLANVWADVLLALLAGSRLRALHEASHIAVHYGLCRQKAWQWELSNVLFQYPAFRPDMHHRYVFHVLEHHRHANEGDIDPNVKRFVRLGMVPGISRAQFTWKLFHSLRPSGLAETFRSMVSNAKLNKTRTHLALRWLTVVLCIAAFWLTGGARGFVVAYLVPLILVYPWFSWISVLAEHRWFIECDEPDRRLREFVVGRPTDYPGVLGWIIRHAIFPATDHYHLAHSLYPFVRWNYMPALDAALKRSEPRYGTHASV